MSYYGECLLPTAPPYPALNVRQSLPSFGYSYMLWKSGNSCCIILQIFAYFGIKHPTLWYILERTKLVLYNNIFSFLFFFFIFRYNTILKVVQRSPVTPPTQSAFDLSLPAGYGEFDISKLLPITNCVVYFWSWIYFQTNQKLGPQGASNWQARDSGAVKSFNILLLYNVIHLNFYSSKT